VKPFLILLVAISLGACVPKQQFDDQQVELREAQERLRAVEIQAQECDPNTFLQLKEQAQSIDLLSQELVDRNTELSREVARLRGVETTCRSQEQDWGAKLNACEQETKDRAERLRKTYEDLVKELKGQISTLEAQVKQLQSAKVPASKPKPKASTPKTAPKP
jgi:chromosome segregation ATPase